MSAIKFPKHLSLSIDHNQHKDYYMTAQQYLEDYEIYNDLDHSIIKEIIDADEIWKIQWYPDTPIGFYYAVASTFEKCVERALEIEKNGD